MRLVIAEKPSVGQSIAKVIGAYERHEGYYEGSGFVVSWCFGHLVELAAPDAYDENTRNGARRIYLFCLRSSDGWSLRKRRRSSHC